MENEQKNDLAIVEPKTETAIVQDALSNAATQATTLKEVIDIGVTSKALQKDGVVETLTGKKEKELNEDADARVAKAETERIEKEKERTEAEKHKIIEETEKAKAYFNAHKEVLKYGFCKEAMTIPYMRVMAVIGTVLMYIIKAIGLPIFIVGKIVEMIIDIVGDIGGKITSNAVKIIVSVFVALLLIAVVIGCCFLFTHILRY